MRRPLKFLILVLAIFLVTFGCNRVSKDERAEKLLKDIVLYQLVAEAEPEVYQSIKDELARSISDKTTPDQINEIARPKLATLRPKYFASCSDDALVGYMKVTFDEAMPLFNQHPTMAYNLLFPTSGKEESDISKMIDAPTKRAEFDALAEVIKTGAKKPKVRLDNAEAPQQFDLIMAELGRKYGRERVDRLFNPRAADVDKNEISAMTIDLYYNVLKLPASTAGPVLRYIIIQAFPGNYPMTT